MEKNNLNKRKIPSIFAICQVFSISLLLLLILGSIVQKREFYSGVFITEVLLIMLPPIVYLFIDKVEVINFLRIKKTTLWELIIVFLLMVSALPVVGVLNLISNCILESIFGTLPIPVTAPPSENILWLSINILVIGGLAGICEEILFRGFVQRGFEYYMKTQYAIIVSSALFALMHLDIQRFFGTFLLGTLIGFIVYRSKNLITGMFAHFSNNALAVFITYKFIKGTNDISRKSGDTLSSIFNLLKTDPVVFWSTFIVNTIFFMGLVYIFVILLAAFFKYTEKNIKEKEELKDYSRGEWIGVLPGIIGVIYVYTIQIWGYLK